MSEMSDMFKLVNAMELAKTARVGMSLTYFDVIELLGEINSLYEYIAELEVENDQLTAQWRQERQDDKCSKPEPKVCEACGGDGTVVLRDGYGGQVIATAKCTYCNGTGRVNKEREE